MATHRVFERDPVMLLHGIGVTGRYWDADLASRQLARRVEAWTLPAYLDEMLPCSEWSAVTGAVLARADQLAWDRFVLLGHSFGGMIAQEVTLTDPERLAALVLVSTTASAGNRSDLDRSNYVEERLKPLKAGASVADITARIGPKYAAPSASADIGDFLRTAALGIQPSAYEAAVKLLSTFYRRADLGRVRTPTLVITGELDKLAPPRVAQRLADRIPGARLCIMPGVGHFPNLECEKLFWSRTRTFLNELD
jgi:3-oxoadipate enol-lactonase